jgi:ribonuclease P protein component
MQILRDKLIFEQTLKNRPIAKTQHFLLHHFDGVTSKKNGLKDEFSIEGFSLVAKPVDHFADIFFRLGMVVPKRYAKRAVTRSLIRHQARAVFAEMAFKLQRGDWVLRLRQTFDINVFPSAASIALARTVRIELLHLIEAAQTINRVE